MLASLVIKENANLCFLPFFYQIARIKQTPRVVREQPLSETLGGYCTSATLFWSQFGNWYQKL